MSMIHMQSSLVLCPLFLVHHFDSFPSTLDSQAPKLGQYVNLQTFCGSEGLVLLGPEHLGRNGRNQKHEQSPYYWFEARKLDPDPHHS
jgi:hypothetical protein